MCYEFFQALLIHLFSLLLPGGGARKRILSEAGTQMNHNEPNAKRYDGIVLIYIYIYIIYIYIDNYIYIYWYILIYCTLVIKTWCHTNPAGLAAASNFFASILIATTIKACSTLDITCARGPSFLQLFLRMVHGRLQLPRTLCSSLSIKVNSLSLHDFLWYVVDGLQILTFSILVKGNCIIVSFQPPAP